MRGVGADLSDSPNLNPPRFHPSSVASGDTFSSLEPRRYPRYFSLDRWNKLGTYMVAGYHSFPVRTGWTTY
jgi:hypothetical protein